MVCKKKQYFCAILLVKCMERRGSFIASYYAQNVTDEDYQQINVLVNAAKAFARTTHQCVYIIDFFKQEFLYVSENLAYWCGLSSEKIKDLSYNFYLDYIPEQELHTLLEINKKGIEFLYEISIEERLDYTLSYDFHLINGRKQRLVNHHLTPVMLTKDGHIWLALCTFSMSAKTIPGDAIIKKPESDSYYEYSFDKHKWLKREERILSETERDILVLSAQGHTMNDISDILCKSIDTIKANKKSLFSKMGVRSIAEAVSYATNYKML